MKLGLDIGSSNLKTDTGFLIPSKIRQGNSLNTSLSVEYEGKHYIIGEGNREVEINKAKRETNLLFIYSVLGAVSEDIENEVAVGLPIGQYQQQKEEYRQFIMDNNFNVIRVNGIEKPINITNVIVCPEGLSSITTDYTGIIVDIGGRTTDICLLSERKVINPISKAVGTLNLYAEIINSINSVYSLDLHEEEAERIIKNGLKIDGEIQNIKFIYDILTAFTDDLINTLKLNYSLRTNELLLMGGGGELFYNSIKKRAKQAQLIENCLFSNAKGFRRALR